MEQFSTQKIIIAHIFLIVLMVVVAIIQINLRFDNMVAMAIMVVGAIVTAGFLSSN